MQRVYLSSIWTSSISVTNQNNHRTMSLSSSSSSSSSLSAAMSYAAAPGEEGIIGAFPGHRRAPAVFLNCFLSKLCSPPLHISNITPFTPVAIRMRPLNSREQTAQNNHVWRVQQKYNSITKCTSAGKPLTGLIHNRTYFSCDKVFGESSTTRQVYEQTSRGIVDGRKWIERDHLCIRTD